MTLVRRGEGFSRHEDAREATSQAGLSSRVRAGYARTPLLIPSARPGGPLGSPARQRASVCGSRRPLRPAPPPTRAVCGRGAAPLPSLSSRKWRSWRISAAERPRCEPPLHGGAPNSQSRADLIATVGATVLLLGFDPAGHHPREADSVPLDGAEVARVDPAAGCAAARARLGRRCAHKLHACPFRTLTLTLTLPYPHPHPNPNPIPSPSPTPNRNPNPNPNSNPNPDPKPNPEPNPNQSPSCWATGGRRRCGARCLRARPRTRPRTARPSPRARCCAGARKQAARPTVLALALT